MDTFNREVTPTAAFRLTSPVVLQDKVEEWGEAYQALCWGALVELINADLQPRARPDKVGQNHWKLDHHHCII